MTNQYNGMELPAGTIMAVSTAVKRHGTTRAELIPVLQDVNRELGYLPSFALEEISRLMRLPKSQVYSVATFYHMLSTEKLGRHIVQFCESAPCHVVGGRQVWETLQEALGLEPGQTSADGKWTLITVSCLGACGVGPVVIIDNKIFGNLTPSQLREVLASYQ